jgi:hypothetical protein
MTNLFIAGVPFVGISSTGRMLCMRSTYLG